MSLDGKGVKKFPNFKRFFKLLSEMDNAQQYIKKDLKIP